MQSPCNGCKTDKTLRFDEGGKMQDGKGSGKAMSDRDAACPFFRRHTRGTIGCESPIPGSFIQLNFHNRTVKRKHYAGWCCANYKYCEIYRMMDEQNSEEG